MRNLLEGINSLFGHEKEEIGELEGRTTEIIESEKQRGKRMKKKPEVSVEYIQIDQYMPCGNPRKRREREIDKNVFEK